MIFCCFLCVSLQTSRINQQIVASDGGNRSSSVELTVIITNVHNQPPHWEQPEYWVTVPENTVRDAKIVVSDKYILKSVAVTGYVFIEVLCVKGAFHRFYTLRSLYFICSSQPVRKLWLNKVFCGYSM